MNDLKFFTNAYTYMVDRIEEKLNKVDEEVIDDCLKLLNKGVNDKRITVAGSGRSLLSLLLFADITEEWYGVRVSQVNNANLRPLIKDDIFISNTRSGRGRVLNNTVFAHNKGLKTIFITSNEEIKKEHDFKHVIIIPKLNGYKKEYAPLGTEFEQASAILCSCLGYSFNNENRIETYKKTLKSIIKELRENLENLITQKNSIKKFTQTINEYLVNDENVVYFKGLGTNEVITRVAAIRYGHLSNEEKDLRVIYEGHWKSRKREDLAILISGSGETNQIIDYTLQAIQGKMNLFSITSIKNSKFATLTKPYGSLIITGRNERESNYNKPTSQRGSYKPVFELNTYLTLDSLLALIAKNNGITETHMQKTHRDKELE